MHKITLIVDYLKNTFFFFRVVNDYNMNGFFFKLAKNPGNPPKRLKRYWCRDMLTK